MIMTTVETVDYHTAGEPFRIVRPQATIPGETVAERRVFAIGDADIQVVTLDSMLDALGSAVVSLRVAPAGTQWPIRTVALFDADDLAGTADSGVLVADLCVLAGVPAATAQSWIHRLADVNAAARPVALVIKDASADLCRAAETAGIAVAVLHVRARVEMVLLTVRRLLEGAASRPREDATSGEAVVEESDLYGLAQRVATITGGLVSIEDDQARLLAYSATDGSADELRMLSILGREGPVEHLRRLRELGVYDRVRRGSAVVEVPAKEGLGWRRRLVVSIQPLGSPDSSQMGSTLGLIPRWARSGSRRASSRSIPTASRCYRGPRRSLPAHPPNSQCPDPTGAPDPAITRDPWLWCRYSLAGFGSRPAHARGISGGRDRGGQR